MVMPMAGRGSRFAGGGAPVPKPLMNLWGRPFFWWAAESARRAFNPVEMVFVVLKDHIDGFAIAENIRDLVPGARIVVVSEVTSGAAETAKIGIEHLRHRGPVLINDTDHAFLLPRDVETSIAGDAQSALLTFRSDSPSYSYARFDADGRVLGTAEKQVVSPDAIAGAYLFASPKDFLDSYSGYEAERRYAETFVSGLFDRLISAGRSVSVHRLGAHLSFGTPEELHALGPRPAEPWANWL